MDTDINNVTAEDVNDPLAGSVSQKETESSNDNIENIVKAIMSASSLDLTIASKETAGDFAAAIAVCWKDWNDETRHINSSHIINSLPPSENDLDIKILVVKELLEIDPRFSFKILAGTAKKLKLGKSGAPNTKLCKVLHKYLIKSIGSKYRQLPINIDQNQEDQKLVVKYLITAAFGHGADSKETLDPAIQIDLAKWLIESRAYLLHEKEFGRALNDAARTWPIANISHLIELHQLFRATFPETDNPFAFIESAYQSTSLQQENPPEEHGPKTEDLVQPKNLEPKAILGLLEQAFQQYDNQICEKENQLSYLKHEIEQHNNVKKKLEESRDRKQNKIDELQDEITNKRSEIDSLGSKLKEKDEVINNLRSDVIRSDKDIAKLLDDIENMKLEKEKAIERLSSQIESVSEHQVKEVKRSIAFDLRQDYEDYQHLNNDNSHKMHLMVIEKIFKKLRGIGIKIGEL